MIVICYGMIKSASTFSFQVIEAMVKRSQPAGRIRYVGLKEVDPDLKFNFVDAKTAYPQLFAKLQLLHADQPAEGPTPITIIKTHMPPGFFKDILTLPHRTILNFRHPAEVALSLMDAAVRDKTRAKTRFVNYESWEAASQQLGFQVSSFLKWNAIPGAHRIYYDDLVTRQEEVFQGVRQAIDDSIDPIVVKNALRYFNEDSKRITEFNKGTLRRRDVELDPQVVTEIESRFPNLIKLIG